MPNLIVAKDNQTGNYATISDAWLDTFPGEFTRVRDALEPITEEEISAQKTATESAAKERTAEIEASAAEVKAADDAAKRAASGEAGDGEPSGFDRRSR